MSGFTSVQFKANDVLFWTGDVADTLYIVEKGTVRILDSRSSHPFATVGKGEWFGEQCLLFNGVRSASAIALEDTECVVVSGERLRQVLAAQSPLMTPLFEALLLQLHMHNSLLVEFSGRTLDVGTRKLL